MLKKELYQSGKSLDIPQDIIDKIILKFSSFSKSELFLAKEIPQKYIHDINGAFQQYILDRPIEYILGKAEFYGLDFFVDERVLIPRNDTEIIIDSVLNLLHSESFSGLVHLIDVGTGSGCIPISIIGNSSKIEKCQMVDISSKALEITHINIKNHNLEEKIEILQGSLLSPIKKFGKNVIITANLPYIKNNDFENMDESVIENEPDSALYGGKKTGFELYEQLISQSIQVKKEYSPKNFFLFIEIGFDQYEYSKQYLENLGLQYEYFKDNGGIWRCVKISM